MKLHLRVISGLHIGDQIYIEPPGGFIGRGDGCALHLRDDSVSRSHLELRFAQEGFWAHQHSSRSPTLIDGTVMQSSPLALREQGVLQVGSVLVEYAHERSPAPLSDLDSPPTMINVRRHLTAIQHDVLPQMTPLRAADTSTSDTPETLILHRPPPADQPADAPPTLIRRPPLPPPMKPPATEPSTLPWSEERDRLEKERDQFRIERDQLAAELLRLVQANKALREAPKAAAPDLQAPTQLAGQALQLLAPFGDSLEQAYVALQEGDAGRARVLLREASFGLADLRDLLESSNS